MPTPSATIDPFAPVLSEDDDFLGLNGPSPVKCEEVRPSALLERLTADGIKPYDGPLRFLVCSRTRPGVDHLVQLDGYNYNGSCGCEHFSNSLLTKLREGVAPSDDTRCEHIKRLRSNLLDFLVKEISEERGDTTADERDGLF